MNFASYGTWFRNKRLQFLICLVFSSPLNLSFNFNLFFLGVCLPRQIIALPSQTRWESDGSLQWICKLLWDFYCNRLIPVIQHVGRLQESNLLPTSCISQRILIFFQNEEKSIIISSLSMFFMFSIMHQCTLLFYYPCFKSKQVYRMSCYKKLRQG